MLCSWLSTSVISWLVNKIPTNVIADTVLLNHDVSLNVPKKVSGHEIPATCTRCTLKADVVRTPELVTMEQNSHTAVNNHVRGQNVVVGLTHVVLHNNSGFLRVRPSFNLVVTDD